MNYFIWDKQSYLLGLEPNVLFNVRPDFKNEDVIVFINENNDIISAETKSYFREKYDIKSDNVDYVALVVLGKIADGTEETILDKLNEQEDLLEDKTYIEFYTDLLEEYMDSAMKFEWGDLQQGYKQIEAGTDYYTDPNPKVYNLDDVSEKVSVKKMTVVINHVFMTEKGNVEEFKFMEKYNDTLRTLVKKEEQAMMEQDFTLAELVNKEMVAMYAEVEDLTDALIRVDATRVYNYGENLIIHCENDQVFIVDMSIVESVKESAIEYEKTNTETDERFRVHYKTVNIDLAKYYNELCERGNTVFITSL